MIDITLPLLATLVLLFILLIIAAIKGKMPVWAVLILGLALFTFIFFLLQLSLMGWNTP